MSTFLVPLSQFINLPDLAASRADLSADSRSTPIDPLYVTLYANIPDVVLTICNIQTAFELKRSRSPQHLSTYVL
jgi:hypothetical protein